MLARWLNSLAGTPSGRGRFEVCLLILYSVDCHRRTARRVWGRNLLSVTLQSIESITVSDVPHHLRFNFATRQNQTKSKLAVYPV